MENVYVLNGLKAKRAELDGEVRAAEKRIVQLRADLGAIDHTIRIFDPAAMPGTIKPKAPRAPSVGFERGDFSRAVLDALREAQEPLTARDIASRIIRGARTGRAGQRGDAAAYRPGAERPRSQAPGRAWREARRYGPLARGVARGSEPRLSWLECRVLASLLWITAYGAFRWASRVTMAVLGYGRGRVTVALPISTTRRGHAPAAVVAFGDSTQ